MRANTKNPKILFLAILLTLPLLMFPLLMFPLPICRGTPTFVFGNPEVPQIGSMNWTWFWASLQSHVVWDLEFNEGSGWSSCKSDLEILRKYFLETTEGDFPINRKYATKCKIALKFNASHSADYRLTLGVDLPVKNHIYKEDQLTYVLTYQEYTVFFDFTDLQQISGLIFNHGVKTVNDTRYFWFRTRKNNIQQGTHVVLDPSFGYELKGGYTLVLKDKIRGSWFTCPVVAIPEKITVALYVSTSGKFRTALSTKSDNTLICQTEERTLSSTPSWEWFEFFFTETYLLEENTDYVITVWAETTSYCYAEAETDKGRLQNLTYATNFPSVWNPTTNNYKHSIYCSYWDQTETEGEEREIENWYMGGDDDDVISDVIAPTPVPEIPVLGLIGIVGVLGFLVVTGAITQLTKKKVFRSPHGRPRYKARSPSGRFLKKARGKK